MNRQRRRYVPPPSPLIAPSGYTGWTPEPYPVLPPPPVAAPVGYTARAAAPPKPPPTSPWGHAAPPPEPIITPNYPLWEVPHALAGVDGVYPVWLVHPPYLGARLPYWEPIDVGQSRDIGRLRFQDGHPREPQWRARQALYLNRPTIWVQAIETPWWIVGEEERESWRLAIESRTRTGLEIQGYLLCGDR